MMVSNSYLLEGNNYHSRYFVLFLVLELVLMACLFFIDYKVLLVFTLVGIIAFLDFWNIKLGVAIMIIFSTMVAYGVKSITGIMLLSFGLILTLICMIIYFKTCLKDFKMEMSRLSWAIIFFLGLTILQVIRGFIYFYELKFIYMEFLAYLGFSTVFLVTTLYKDRKLIKRIFEILIIVAYWQTFIGLANYFQVGHRIGGHLFSNFPSLIAMVLLNIAFYSPSRIGKLKYILLSIPLILHLMFSFTRGYWLGFLIALLISYLIYTINTKNNFPQRLLYFSKGVILGGGALLLLITVFGHFLSFSNLTENVAGRFSSSFSVKAGAQTATNYARLVEYFACWEKIKEQPIWGYGIGYALMIKVPILQSQAKQWFIHQSYLMIMLKMGLIGLLSFLWIFYVFFRIGFTGSKKIPDNYYRGLSYGFIFNAVQLLVISLTNYDFAAVVNTYYIGFAMGSVIILISHLDKPMENTTVINK